MDQLYEPSQVSNITREINFLTAVDMFSKIKKCKNRKKRTQNCTYFTVKQALYSKIITIINNFVGHKT